MISSFKNFLVEEEQTVYFTYGRMNPPTIGHEKLLNVLAKSAGSNPYRIFLSKSSLSPRNPIEYKTKIKFARKLFPKHARNIIYDNNIKGILFCMVNLFNAGFKNVNMVVGEDRVSEFKILLKKYNAVKSDHGFYNFNRIDVISAGHRDPDLDSIEGISASKLRKFAADDNYSEFIKGVPTDAQQDLIKDLFNEIRLGLGLKKSSNFKLNLKLEQVSEKRDKYINGDLFSVGDKVMIKNNFEEATIKYCGSNYIILEQNNGFKVRKWIDDVIPISQEKQGK